MAEERRPAAAPTAQAESVLAGQARSDWAGRIGRPTGEARRVDLPRLAAPTGLRAEPGRAQVTLDWAPVDGAVGYLVHRSPSADGPFEPLDHLGRDVLAVPHPPYADTTGPPGRQWWYAVAAIADVSTVGELSTPVLAGSAAAGDPAGHAAVSVHVDAGAVVRPLPRPWRPMIGSEHLSHLLSTDESGGQPIGEELAEALRIVATELGVQAVRAHAIFGDDLGVYREKENAAVYDFSGVDRVYDLLLSIGLRPIVELSFMPRDLAAGPSKTVFAYEAIVSPPKDWDRWHDLVQAFVAHLVQRYGLPEVRDHWAFEVWNEANLEVFWSGTPDEYLRLYEVTSHAVKAVHPELRVGGPSSAAAAWVDELLGHAIETNAAVDFVSTHTYGSPPLDLRPALDRYGKSGTPLWWTEWGVTPQHFHHVSESAFAAAFLARGMRSAAGRIDALSYWVASDHFEELGRPTALLHGGFGLLTVGNLRKPRFYALALLERLGEHELAASLTGDGAGSLVEAWAARDDDGRVTVALWNGTLDQSKTPGDPMLARSVTVEIAGLDAAAYTLRHFRVDLEHSNIAAVWERIRAGSGSGGSGSGGSGSGSGADAREKPTKAQATAPTPGQELPAWPDEAGWAALRAANRLEELHPPQHVTPVDRTYTVAFDLPMPAVSFLELTPRH